MSATMLMMPKAMMIPSAVLETWMGCDDGPRTTGLAVAVDMADLSVG